MFLLFVVFPCRSVKEKFACEVGQEERVSAGDQRVWCRRKEDGMKRTGESTVDIRELNGDDFFQEGKERGNINV